MILSKILKDIDNEEGRREYYTYDPSNPVTMQLHVEPYLDPRFNEELLEIFGKDPHGDPRLRIVWGGTLRAVAFRHMEDGTSMQYDGMKYPYMRIRVIKGYHYYTPDGKRVRVMTRDRVPKDALFSEDFDYDDLGQMKFVLEMKYTAEEMVQIQRYPVPGSDEEVGWCFKNGKQYRAEPNPLGEYIFCHYIETEDGRFADVTQNTIDSIRNIFNTATTETEAEYVKRKLETRQQLLIAAKEKEALDYADHVDNARIRAEKKLGKGKILYSV